MAQKKRSRWDKRIWLIRFTALGCALLMLATVIIAAIFSF